MGQSLFFYFFAQLTLNIFMNSRNLKRTCTLRFFFPFLFPIDLTSRPRNFVKSYFLGVRSQFPTTTNLISLLLGTLWLAIRHTHTHLHKKGPGKMTIIKWISISRVGTHKKVARSKKGRIRGSHRFRQDGRIEPSRVGISCWEIQSPFRLGSGATKDLWPSTIDNRKVQSTNWPTSQLSKLYGTDQHFLCRCQW